MTAKIIQRVGDVPVRCVFPHPFHRQQSMAKRAETCELLTSKPDILFDVDGVLVHPPFRFRDHLERNHGITTEMTAPFFQGPFKACLTGNADLNKELEGYLVQWGWPGTTASFIETWMQIDGAPDLMMLELAASLKLQGFKCHIASVQERTRATFLRQSIDFENLFNETFFSCDIGSAKPGLAFFQQIQAQLARPSHELLLVDDSHACVEAARVAGWKAFHYTGPNDRVKLSAAIASLCATIE